VLYRARQDEAEGGWEKRLKGTKGGEKADGKTWGPACFMVQPFCVAPSPGGSRHNQNRIGKRLILSRSVLPSAWTAGCGGRGALRDGGEARPTVCLNSSRGEEIQPARWARKGPWERGGIWADGLSTVQTDPLVMGVKSGRYLKEKRKGGRVRFKKFLVTAEERTPQLF